MAKIYAALAMKKTRPTQLTLRQRSDEDSGRSLYDGIESDLLETSLVKLPAKAILEDRSARHSLVAKASVNLREDEVELLN